MARQNIGKERTVSYSEMVTSNRGCGFVKERQNQNPSGILEPSVKEFKLYK